MTEALFVAAVFFMGTFVGTAVMAILVASARPTSPVPPCQDDS